MSWQPTNRDYQLVFSEQNPWHQLGEVPGSLARPVERPLAASMWARLEKDPPRRYQLVLGPRRVGKTTTMYQTVRRLLGANVPARRLWWLRLDHPLLMQVPLGDLVRFVLDSGPATPSSPIFLFLDELTYASQWDLWLKTFYDEQWPVQIMGSSSSPAALKSRRTESGVGRWEEQYLAPYLFDEFLELVDRQRDVPVGESLGETIRAVLSEPVSTEGLAELRRRFLLTGGFPELLIGLKQQPIDETSALLESQRTLRNDAVERAIYKDIPQAHGIENPMVLERMLYTLAGQVANLLSPKGICQTLGGLAQPTFDRYLSYLERAFLVFTLQNYSGSEAARQRRGRKLYFVDGAIRNAALQRGIAPLRDPGEMGLLLENAVASHLHALSMQTGTRVFHWRDGSDHEVDLIYDHPERPLAFEVGNSTGHSRGGLYALQDRYPRFRGGCYIIAPDAIPQTPASARDGVGSLPLDLALLIVGAQASWALRQRLGNHGEPVAPLFTEG